MKKYTLCMLRGDFFGGITAGIIALPLALAFGVASGAGAAAGLYGAIALGLLAAIFGGTRTQISGPTGPMTVVTASALVSFSDNPQAVFTVIILAGVFQIILGLIRAGVFVKFMPYPVISGFMSGIGIIIVLLQFNPLLGVAPVNSPLKAVLGVKTALTQINFSSLYLGLLTLLIVFKTPAKIARIVPTPLIALVLLSYCSYFFSLSVNTIGEIPTSLPSFLFPSIPQGEFRHVILLAITLAVLGSIDSLLTSLVADSLTKSRHSSNRELVGQGIGNMVAGFFGGLAGAGATMRTVVNIKTGGTTRLSGVIHAVFLLAVLLVLGPLASHVPMAVLAGILVKVGIDILDYRLLRVVRKAPKHDLYVMIVVLAVTVFVDLIIAVGVGVTLAAVLLTFRIARQTQLSIMEVSQNGDSSQLQIERAIQQTTDYQIRIVNIQGPFFFGSTSQVLDKVDTLLGTKVIVINCLDVPFMDLSAVFALEETIVKLKDSGIEVILVTKEKTRQKLFGLGLGKLLGAERLLVNYDNALAEAKKILENQKIP